MLGLERGNAGLRLVSLLLKIRMLHPMSHSHINSKCADEGLTDGSNLGVGRLCCGLDTRETSTQHINARTILLASSSISLFLASSAVLKQMSQDKARTRKQQTVDWMRNSFILDCETSSSVSFGGGGGGSKNASPPLCRSCAFRAST